VKFFDSVALAVPHRSPAASRQQNVTPSELPPSSLLSLPFLLPLTLFLHFFRGRKDFTALLSAARNLSRLIWIQVTLPSEEIRAGKDLVKADGTKGKHVGLKEELTRDILKKDKIRFLK